jgi:hypothetical protein|nr:MAG TPA: hypothetical protein [Caudoviricetes sp.]
MEQSKVIWGIVTYNRTDRQQMLLYLNSLGYNKDEIIVHCQTEQDYNTLTEKYDSKATILYKKGRNVCENKNNLLDWVCSNRPNTKLIICSDKVRGIKFLNKYGKGTLITKRETLDYIIRRAFLFTERQHGVFFGCYPVQNDFFMKHTISINQLVLGCFMGFPNPEAIRFDTEQPLKEDFEIVLRCVNNGLKMVRFNDICLRATFHTKGGAHELWNADGDKVNEYCTRRILKKYPNLAKQHATRKNEIRYTGKSIVINKSILYDAIL